MIDLPNPFAKTQPEQRLYLLVLLTDQSVQSVLWDSQMVAQSLNTATGMSGLSPVVATSTALEYTADDEFVVKLDESLQQLGKASENVDDVVLVVPPEWLEAPQGDILPEKKVLIKAAQEQLRLKLLGYLVTTEAVAAELLASNARAGQFVIEVTPKSLTLSLVQQGKLVGSQTVGRSQDPAADVVEAAVRQNWHDLAQMPQRMVVAGVGIDDQVLHKIEQTLVQADWQQLAFVQDPLVSKLQPDQLIQAAVTQSAVSILGVGSGAVTAGQAQSQPMSDQTAEKISAQLSQTNVETSLPYAADNLTAVPEATATSFGIPVKVDQTATANTPEQVADRAIAQAQSVQPMAAKTDNSAPAVDTSKKRQPRVSLPTNSWLARIGRWFSHHRWFALGGVGAGLVTTILMSSLILANQTTATVLIDVASQTVTDEVTIEVVADQADADPAQRIIAGETVTLSVSGSKTVATSGLEEVGDAASGRVTLFNKTSSSKSFAAGTELSVDGLTFTLNESVQIASASTTESDGGSQTSYGSADVAVIAAAIGEASNLSAGADLQVETFSRDTYEATVTSDGLSGGTSQEVQVVAAADQTKARDELIEQLLEDANQKLREQAAEGTFVIPAAELEVDDSSFDGAVGEEAETLTLTMDATVSTLAYQSESLKPLAESVLQSQIPEGFELAPADLSILSAPSQNASGSGSVVLEANLSAQVQPILDITTIVSQISRQRLTVASEQIGDLQHVEAVEIVLDPPIAGRLRPRLPKKPENITVLLSTDPAYEAFMEAREE